MNVQRITIQGFLNEFKRRHEQMQDRPFCWILGSGASVQSGIPTGGRLVRQWLEELHELEDFNGLPIEAWATEENLGIPGFEFANAANFYPWIYQRRFRDYKEQGYAFLENVMDSAEPSFGYSVLAQIMATTHHKIAVTTNFDNLVADALSIYTRTSPLICGHESLTGYIRPNLRRPLIAKIHRDLLLNPKNSPSEIEELPPEWGDALTKIFERFTPIVIGYGGNDGSLMGFLKKAEPIEGGMYWCYREGDEISSQIPDIVGHHSGRLVPIAGFDEVMLQLQEKLALPFLLPQLMSFHKKRVEGYQEQFQKLTTALRTPAPNPAAEMAREQAREAAKAAVERLTKERDWWAWHLKAMAESDPAKREAIYEEGLRDFPESVDLLNNTAAFFNDVRRDYDRAIELYKRAIELDPNHPIVAANLALLLSNHGRDYDEAERLYRKAYELDPKNARTVGGYATFTHNFRDDQEFTRELYQQALELDPTNAVHSCNYANFLYLIDHDFDEAEKYYRMGCSLDRNDALNLCNFASFLIDIRKDYDLAEALLRRALELNPNLINGYITYADLLHRGRKNYEEAERFYRKGFEIDPDHAILAGYFGTFLSETRRGDDEAEALLKKSLELDPRQASTTANYAKFLADVRKDYDQADRLYKKAIELDPADASIAEDYDEFRRSYQE